MFVEGERFMQDINEAIGIFPEDKDNEVLRRAEIIPKRENNSAGIDRLVKSFDRKTYIWGNNFL